MKNNMVKKNQFYDDGNTNREKENFQDFSFENVDLRKTKLPISFVRSDFRGAIINNSYFFKNNFSNADFIDSVISDTVYDKCKFNYSEFYNTYMKGSSIKDITFNNASFVRMIFDNCKFENMKMKGTTIRDCKFIDCNILKANFEKSSMDEIEFENISFTNTDLSNMTSLNFYFSDCNFQNVIIDPDYLGSYFFKGELLNKLKMRYRGRILEINISHANLLDNLFRMFIEKKRYYEAINIIIQKALLENKKISIFNILISVVSQLISESNILKRSYQLDKLFRILEYYFNTGYILIDDYFKAINYFDNFDAKNLTLEEKLSLHNRNEKLKDIMNAFDYSNEFISTFPEGKTILVKITIEETHQKIFEKEFRNYILKLASNHNITENSYEIISKRKASIEYEIMMYGTLALLTLNYFKRAVKDFRTIVNEGMQLLIDFQSNRKILLESKKAKTLSQIKLIKELQNISSKIIERKDMSEDKDLIKLMSIIKSLKLYPNTSSDSGN